MKRTIALALSTIALLYVPSAAMAQNAAPTFQGDPDVYKVIFEDQNYRVIAATRKKGVHDKAHGHPVPSIVYFVTDCSNKQYGADGKTTENTAKAGSANAVPAIPSHSAENTGAADCQQLRRAQIAPRTQSDLAADHRAATAPSGFPGRRPAVWLTVCAVPFVAT
jgi:hypothetical protein